MPEIVFIDPHGARHPVQAEDGRSVMRIATGVGIAGIVGECGGCMSCGTCHVYVRDDWLAALLPPSVDELAVLEALLTAAPNSRLSCQLRVSAKLNGLVVTVPPDQG